VTAEKRPQFLVPDLTGFTVRMSPYGHWLFYLGTHMNTES